MDEGAVASVQDAGIVHDGAADHGRDARDTAGEREHSERETA
jgi:hypothetical protein